MRLLITIPIIFVIMIFLYGCSQSSSTIPPIDTESGVTSSLVGVSETYDDGSVAGGQGALGIFSVSIDIENLKGEITSLRKSSLTDVLETVDITNFLQLVPCSDCVKISSISLNADGNLVVTIGIKHPFPAGDPFKPITGQNRGDLHVFNIEGIVVSDGTSTLTFPGLGKSAGTVGLISADGYTGYLDSSLDEIYPTDAELHPYVLHFDDYSAGNFSSGNPMGFASVTDPPPSGNLVMAMGCDYDEQDYIFDIEDNSFEFIYAVGCTYAVAAENKTQRFTPEYRVPQHLKKAASEISIEIPRNELMAGSPTSEADIQVRVVDMSHGVPEGTALDEMFASSDVGSVILNIPGILSSTVSSSTSTSGSGHDPTDPLIFDFTIQNEMNAESGTYYGLVKVQDTYTPGQNTVPLLDGMDGLKRVHPFENPLTGLFPIDEFATYQLFTIDVSFENSDPVVGPVNGCLQVIEDIPFTFTVTADDPDPGQTLTYYWDNGENTPGEYDDAETAVGVAELTYENVGFYTVDVRVEDGVGGVGYSSDPLDVEVLPYGTFVDADFPGDFNDGSYEYPYIAIQEGIDNVGSSGIVYVLPAVETYDPFTFVSNITVKGFDVDCGLDRPIVEITTPNTYANGVTNITMENLIFDFDINSSGNQTVATFSNITNGTIRNCKYTGTSAANYTYVLTLSNYDNGLLEQCEFADIEFDGDPSIGYRYHFVLYINGCDTITVKHNEFHDISIPDLGPDNYWSGIYGVRGGGGSNMVIKNNLFYNFSDYSQTTPRDASDYCNVLHSFMINGGSYELVNNTIDNFNAIARDPDENGWSVGFYGLANGTHMNNIWSSTHYYVGPGGGHNDAGFWADGSPETWATYCCVYWGDTSPPAGSQVRDYLNRIHRGTGCYGTYDFQDPDYDLTDGPNYYHPQNSNIANGANDGTEMGAFGGPDGDWTPPSQIYG